MDLKLKDYLKIAIIILSLAATYAVLSYVNAYSKSIRFSSSRSFSVSGEGKAVIIPDVAEFNFNVITEGGKNLADLQKENSEKANKAIEFLKENDVSATDIKTKNYDIYPRYQTVYCPKVNVGGVCPPPEIAGYTITQTVAVKVRNFEKIGQILSGIVENGANSLSDLIFKADDETKVRNEAREKAITAAKEKARVIAEAGDFRIGRLLSVDENNEPFFYGRSFALGKGDDNVSPAPAPVIAPGSEEIVVTVFLRYEIK